jgi:hypothetical protein
MYTKNGEKQACIYLDQCNLHKTFKTNSKIFWISTYCTGNKQSACMLRNYKDYGCTVPENLLPNGSFL